MGYIPAIYHEPVQPRLPQYPQPNQVLYNPYSQNSQGWLYESTVSRYPQLSQFQSPPVWLWRYRYAPPYYQSPIYAFAGLLEALRNSLPRVETDTTTGINPVENQPVNGQEEPEKQSQFPIVPEEIREANPPTSIPKPVENISIPPTLIPQPVKISVPQTPPVTPTPVMSRPEIGIPISTPPLPTEPTQGSALPPIKQGKRQSYDGSEHDYYYLPEIRW